MPGERPSYIPPENPFSSSEGKLPPEPTAQFVERYLGKQAASGAAKEADVSDDLLTAEERAELAQARQPEVAPGLENLLASEREKLNKFFELKIEVPPLPADVTAERVETWRDIGFMVHYLPRVEVSAPEPGMQVPLKFNYIKKEKIDLYGPDKLKGTELPGAWVLIDEREKPPFSNGQQKYDGDADLERIIGKLRQGDSPIIQPNWSNQSKGERYNPDDSRFGISWEELHKKEFVDAVAQWLNVRPDQVRLPRAIEFSVLGNLHKITWGSTDTWEWFEDSYDGGQRRLDGGNSQDGGLALVVDVGPDNRNHSVGFRPLVVLS